MKRRQFRAILLQAYTKNKEKLEHGANFKILTKVRIYKEEKSKQLNNFMPSCLPTSLQYTKNKKKLENQNRVLISKWKILTEVRIYEEETISCHLATSLQYTKNKEKLEQGVIDKISRDRVSKDKDSCCRFYHADIVQSNIPFDF